MPKNQSGQSLNEYALALALIAVAAIGSLMLVGNGIKTLFQDKLPGDISKATTMAADANRSGTRPKVSGGNTPYPTAEVRYTTASGKTIMISDYPTNTAETVQTIGANGATAVLAGKLKNLADQLLAAGEITQEEYVNLTKLSNYGHNLGDMFKAIEPVMTSAADYSTAYRSGVKFQGKSTSVGNLLYYNLDMPNQHKPPLTDLLTPALDPKAYKGDLLNFYNTYQELNRNGTLDDPATKAVVQGLSYEIVSVVSAFDEALWRNGSTADTIVLSPDLFTTQTAKQMVHHNSAGICNAGGGQDSGVHCSG